MARKYATEIFQALGIDMPETEESQVAALWKRGFAVSYFWYGKNSRYPCAEINLYVDNTHKVLASTEDMWALLSLRERTYNNVSLADEDFWRETLQKRKEEKNDG